MAGRKSWASGRRAGFGTADGEVRPRTRSSASGGRGNGRVRLPAVRTPPGRVVRGTATPSASVLASALTSALLLACGPSAGASAAAYQKPYDKQCTERAAVFAFTKKPRVRFLGHDRYEVSFAVKGFCDVTVAVVDGAGKVVRHLASGVLGKNAPAPFQKNSLSQTVFWNGKDDLGRYSREPGKLKIRVMLGLQPEFDRVLFGASPHSLLGGVWGVATGPDGAYVFTKNERLYDLCGRGFGGARACWPRGFGAHGVQDQKRRGCGPRYQNPHANPDRG